MLPSSRSPLTNSPSPGGMTVSHPIIPLKPIALVFVPPYFFHLTCKFAFADQNGMHVHFKGGSLRIMNSADNKRKQVAGIYTRVSEYTGARVARAVLLFLSLLFAFRLIFVIFFFFLYSVPRRLRGLGANVLVFHLLFNPTGFIKSNQMCALLIPLHLNRCKEVSRRIFVCMCRCIFLQNPSLHSARAL